MSNNVKSEVAIIAIDIQNCFLPGGKLPTGNSRNQTTPPSTLGKSVAKFINNVKPDHIFITKDYHTEGHTSFLSQQNTNEGRVTFPNAVVKLQDPVKGIALGRYSSRTFSDEKRFWGDDSNRHHQKLWPPHCVQGNSPNVDVARELAENISPTLQSRVTTILKGDDGQTDSYSAVADALGFPTPHDENGKSFLQILKESNIKEVHLTGIARDVCVYWTAMDLLNYWIIPKYKETNEVIKLVFQYDLTRPVWSDPKGLNENGNGSDITKQQINQNVVKLLKNMGLSDDIANKLFKVEMKNELYNASGGRNKTKRQNKKCNRRHTHTRRCRR